MVFSSIVFLLYFLPAFLLLYILLPKKWRNPFILFASILFYSFGAPKFVFVILGSTFIDFFIVRALHKATELKKRKWLLASSIFINLGLLLYFKYANFFVENVNMLLSSLGVGQMSWVEVALPIGISFYTFQTLTYSIDVYRGVHAPLRKVSDYMLYIMSFPQMIAGPIVRFNEIADQITGRKEVIDDRLMGFYRFIIGLSKKVLIANVMAEQADMILNSDLSQLSTTNAWIGILAYTFQIYFDFSGYSDMAIGLGRMMGFKFPENFESPYTSRSISEFWRRWHITLGNFMRDYLYIPLGGNRVNSSSRLYFNLGLVFLLSGLWHGASWNFVLWGAFHGLFLILDRLFLLKFLKRIGTVPSVLFTFSVTVVGWVLFRLENSERMWSYLTVMFNPSKDQMLQLLPGIEFYFIIASFFAFFVLLPGGQKIKTVVYRDASFALSGHLFATILTVALFLLCLSALLSSAFNPFIYFRF